MRYKCVSVSQYEHWLTIGKLYEAETVVSPKEFSGSEYLLVKRADDGNPAYARLNQFTPYREGGDNLAV